MPHKELVGAICVLIAPAQMGAEDQKVMAVARRWWLGHGGRAKVTPPWRCRWRLTSVSGWCYEENPMATPQFVTDFRCQAQRMVFFHTTGALQ